MAVSDDNIILGSIFINDPDDSYALEKTNARIIQKLRITRRTGRKIRNKKIIQLQ